MPSKKLQLVAGYTLLYLVLCAGCETPRRFYPTLTVGTVVSVDITEGTLVIKPMIGEIITVPTDKDTEVRIVTEEGSKEGSLRNIVAGMGIGIRPETGVATQVTAKHIDANDARWYCTVVRKDTASGTLVVQPPVGDNINVETNKDTKFWLEKQKTDIRHVKVGMRVSIMPMFGTARRIYAWKAGHPDEADDPTKVGQQIPRATLYLGKWVEATQGQEELLVTNSSIEWKHEGEAKKIFSSNKLKILDDGMKIVFESTEIVAENPFTGMTTRRSIQVTIIPMEGQLRMTIPGGRTLLQPEGLYVDSPTREYRFNRR